MKYIGKKFLFFGTVAIPVILSLVPLFQAQAAGIVPCGGPGQTDCNICWFFVLLRQTMDFMLFEAATAFAAVALAIAGFMYLVSGSNPGYYEIGKNIATNVFKGYLIMLAGWLFINTFFMVVGVTEWSGLKEGWWKVKATCGWHEEINPECGDSIWQIGEKCDFNMTVATCQARMGGTKKDCEDIISRCDKNCNLEAKMGCGDGEVQPDNNEECDPKETVNDCRNRTKKTTVECQDLIGRCDADTCKLPKIVENQCTNDKDKIGMGCYLDENNNGKVDDSECKKGKYVCIPSLKKIECVNVFGDQEYTKAIYRTDLYDPASDYTGKDNFYVTDYCCANMMAEYADGKIGDKPFTIVRATPADLHLTGGKTLDIAWGTVNLDSPSFGQGLKGGFNCDEICKKAGKLCVGVGMTDPSKNACVYEVHDDMGMPSNAAKCNNGGVAAVSMEVSANKAINNCKAYYGFIAYSRNNHRWAAAFDKYEYFCAMHHPYFGSLMFLNQYKEVPDDSCGTCKPKAAANETCTGFNYKQDPSDSCDYHGNDIGETACYCY